jgi:hypothetical protein
MKAPCLALIRQLLMAALFAAVNSHRPGPIPAAKALIIPEQAI